jgi:tetratricopeptide (TPR) repeat protein/thiol-disulfide isomerase/thioredoxin
VRGGSNSQFSLSAPQVGRVVLLNPVPLPELSYRTLERPQVLVPLPRGRPLLLGFWATWCAPCIDELTQWTHGYGELAGAGLNIAALCVDQPADDAKADLANVPRIVERLNVPFATGMAADNVVAFVDIAQRTFTPAQRPLPLPCSFLIDARGRLAVIYKGPVSVDQIVADCRLLEAPSHTVLAGAVPFAGKWLARPAPMPLRKLVLALYEAGQVDAAKDYLNRLIAQHESGPGDRDELAQLYRFQGAIFMDERSTEKAATAYRNVLRFDPRDSAAHLELGNLALLHDDLIGAERHLNAALQVQPQDAAILKAGGALRIRQGQLPEAIAMFRRSLSQRDDAEVHFALANALIATGQTSEAVLHFEASLRLRPGWPPAANNLAWILATSPDDSLRDGERALELAAQACRATNQSVPELLLTYGAALAEVGRFDQAVAVVQSAVVAARRTGDRDFVSKAQTQLDRYRNRQPTRSEANGH